MTTPTTIGSASVHIDATASDVFSALANLDLLPQFSPENVRCEFLGDATELQVGTRFRGWNRNGDYEWHADCVVTALDAPRKYEFQVPPDFKYPTTWTFEIEPDADGTGCIVTESFHAPMLDLPEVYPGKIEGRRDNLENACQVTLSNLKQLLETSAD